MLFERKLDHSNVTNAQSENEGFWPSFLRHIHVKRNLSWTLAFPFHGRLTGRQGF